MIVGTAGHIDHGKTSLIRCLTGKETDRLPEEKRRGITIELGYAYLPFEENVIGFVDVPGHERFIHTMVAGATGIDFALLVIAADDGPMPQTYEHLDILRLLGVEEGAIVLTKIDTVDPIFADASLKTIETVVAGGFASRWPVFPVSSVTGEGIDALRRHLQAMVRQAGGRRVTAGGFRLAVDRAFTLTGIGTVVTGTAHSGTVSLGDEVRLSLNGMNARVRGIHAQDRTADQGFAGQRLALNLASVGVDAVPRGSWVSANWLEASTTRCDMFYVSSNAHDRTITQGLQVHLHHGADHMMATLFPLDQERISPGGQGLVSLISSRPLFACVSDAIIVRDSQAKTTLGGGRILDVHPPARGKRNPVRLQTLNAVAHMNTSDALDAVLQMSSMQCHKLKEAWNWADDQMALLLGGYPQAGGTVFHPTTWNRHRQAVLRAVEEAHVRESEMPGLELNRCRRVACPQLEPEAFMALAESLVVQGELTRLGVFLARPGHKAELSPAEHNLWQSLAPLLQENPFNPPRVRDIAKTVNIPEPEIRANLRRVSRMGEVTLVALDHFFLTTSVAAMADIVERLAEAHQRVRASDFRDAIGGGRKVAIQILEFFDRVGYTRRVKDEHVLRRENPWRATAE